MKKFFLMIVTFEITLLVTFKYTVYELWTEVCDIVQEAVIKTIPKGKKCKKEKWLPEDALQIAEKRREAKG